MIEYHLSFKKKILFSLIVVFFVLGLFELILRIWTGSDKRPWVMLDPMFGWRLKPGSYIFYTPTTEKKENIIVNSLGFRGKEFSIQKPEGVFRIIALGDSVTFGLGPESCPYPVQLEHMLQQSNVIPSKWKRVEVINGGVEGYGTENIFRKLQSSVLSYNPDAILLLTSWNDLYGLDPTGRISLPQLPRWLNSIYLVKAMRRFLFLYTKPLLITSPQNNVLHSNVEEYQNFFPTNYAQSLQKSIDTARAYDITIILATLPSPLYEGISLDDFKIRYLPYFTSDINNVRILQSIYNRVIIEKAQQNTLPLVDLDKTFREMDNQKRKNLFYDPIHPHCSGQTVIANSFYTFLQNTIDSFR